ncbi:MAG: ATP-binding cassette domain-containing protein [Acidimicrobiales bacterium]
MTDAVEAPDLLLEARAITKRFPGVVANADVSLQLHRGEILALLGENGAGKSTLVKMLFGLYKPDEGEIRIKGEPVALRSPKDAISRGIGMVHQHFQLVPVMHRGRERGARGRTPQGQLHRSAPAAAEVRKLSERYGLAVDPEASYRRGPTGRHAAAVEIIKSCSGGRRSSSSTSPPRC